MASLIFFAGQPPFALIALIPFARGEIAASSRLFTESATTVLAPFGARLALTHFFLLSFHDDARTG